jgi:hypothetical protein
MRGAGWVVFYAEPFGSTVPEPPILRRIQAMTKLMIMVTSTIGSAIGWWVGAKIGIMTAFMVSMLGTGIGIYYGRKAAQHFEL